MAEVAKPAPSKNNFQEKDKPTEVRLSNIVAAKGKNQNNNNNKRTRAHLFSSTIEKGEPERKKKDYDLEKNYR